MPHHLENRGEEEAVYYYQIDYTLGEVPQDAAYFHAQFRRVNPLPYKEVYTILDGVQGQGHYVGTYMAWGVHNNGWWGEGEIKFYLDGDQEAPTICGTGTEDYFCGSYNFEDPRTHSRYVEFSTPYGGFYPVTQDGLYQSQKRFGAYRFHIADPIRFAENLRVTIQALGWRDAAGTCPCRTISPRWPSGTRRRPPRPSPPCRTGSFWRLSKPTGKGRPLQDGPFGLLF